MKHFLTEKHQIILIHVVRQLKSILPNAIYNHPKNSPQIHTTENDPTQLQELHQTVAILSDSIETLNDDVTRLSSESIRYQNELDPCTEDLSTLKISTEEQNAFIDGIKLNQEMLQQDVASLEQKVNDMKSRSYDGTFIWRITNVHEKMGQQLKDMMFYLVEALFVPMN